VLVDWRRLPLRCLEIETSPHRLETLTAMSDERQFSQRGGGYGDSLYPSDARSPQGGGGGWNTPGRKEASRPHRAGYPVDSGLAHPAARPSHSHVNSHHSMAYHHGSGHAVHGGPENPWAESQAGPFGAPRQFKQPPALLSVQQSLSVGRVAVAPMHVRPLET
jgi:hypothetical protein